MSKRKAPYELDQAAPDLGKVSTPEEIAQRRILKIKGPKSEESTTPAKLVLLQKLDETIPAESKEEKSNATSETTNGDKKEEVKPATTGSSLFGNLNGNNDKKEETKPAGSSLFGNLPPTTGLFSSTTNSLFNTGSSLFGNSTNTGTGLFANIKKDEGSKIGNIFSTDKPAGSLFGNSTATTNLFANSKTPEASSLFGNLQKNAATAGGLFANANKEGSDDEGDEGDGEDDDELEHSPEIDPSQVEIKYQYNNPYEKVIDKSVVKLRRGEGDILEKGFISFEKFKADEKTPNIFVYRDQIKKVIFTLLAIKKISKVEKINNSTKNLKFIFYKKQEEKLVPDILKVQFHDEKEGEEFFNKIKEYIEN